MTKARTNADNASADIQGVTAGTGLSGGGTSGTVTLTNDMATTIAAKGDLLAGTANDAYAALTVGANNTVLTADSAEATGLKWAAPASSGLTWSLLNAGGTALTGANTITVSGISNQKQLLILVMDASKVAASENYAEIRFNGDSGSNYTQAGIEQTFSSTYDNGNFSDYDGYSNLTRIRFFRFGDAADDQGAGSLFLDNADTTGWKRFNAVGSGRKVSGFNQGALMTQGIYEASASITSVSIITGGGAGSNFDAGTIYVLGAV